MRTPLPRRGLLVILALVSTAATAKTANARDPSVEACAIASESGQRAAATGQLAEARAQFLVCAQACPATIRRDCEQRLSQTEADLPSIIISLRDAGGHDVTIANVTIDGRAAPRALAGEALTLDPGPHTLRVELGKDVVVESLVLRAGEKARPVELRVGAPLVPSRVSWAVYPLAGIGIAGVAAFTALAIAGQSTYESCLQGCDSSRRSGLEAERVVAWAALGGGIASLAAATAVFLGGTKQTVSVGAAALPDTAYVVVGGAF
jgi:hypothetical protein